MKPWLRNSLIGVGALIVLLAIGAVVLVATFDANRYKGLAIDWMKSERHRTLAIDGPIDLSVFPRLEVKLSKLRSCPSTAAPTSSSPSTRPRSRCSRCRCCASSWWSTACRRTACARVLHARRQGRDATSTTWLGPRRPAGRGPRLRAAAPRCAST